MPDQEVQAYPWFKTGNHDAKDQSGWTVDWNSSVWIAAKFENWLEGTLLAIVANHPKQFVDDVWLLFDRQGRKANAEIQITRGQVFAGAKEQEVLEVFLNCFDQFIGQEDRAVFLPDRKELKDIGGLVKVFCCEKSPNTIEVLIGDGNVEFGRHDILWSEWVYRLLEPMSPDKEDSGWDRPGDWEREPLAKWADSEDRLCRLLSIPHGDLDGYRAAIEQNPSIEAVTLFGYTQRKQKKFRGAEETFKFAVQCEPTNLDALYGYADILRTQNFNTAALAFLTKLADEHPANADIQLVAAELLLKFKRDEQAYVALSRAIQLEPESARINELFGSVLRNKGRSNEATKHFLRAIELDPSSTSAKLALAHCLMFASDDAEAILWAAEEAHRLMPDKWEVVELYARALLLNGELPKAKALAGAQYVKQPKRYGMHTFANDLLDYGYSNEALECFRLAMGELSGVKGLGGALEEIGRLDEAFAHYERMAERNVSDSSVARKVAEAFLRHGRLEKGLEWLLRSDSESSLTVVVEVYYCMGEKQLAQQNLRRMSQLFARNSRAREILGYILVDAGHRDEALTHFQPSRGKRGAYEKLSYGPQDDMQALRNAAARNKKAISHIKLARALYNRTMFPGAIASLHRALAMEPNNAEANSLMGLCYCEAAVPLRRLAVVYFRRALDSDPRFVEALAGLALCYRNMSRNIDARSVLRELRDVDPKHPELTNSSRLFGGD